MPNKIKLVDSSADNILTSNFKDVGTDGSGQSNVGSREDFKFKDIIRDLM